MTHLVINRALGALVLASCAIALPAVAQSVGAPTSISVSYRDLDIAHPAGAAVLLRRLRTAADKACGSAPDIRALDQEAAFETCRKAAVDKAVAQLNARLVSEMAAASGAPVRLARR